jgi:hypothetical protein
VYRPLTNLYASPHLGGISNFVGAIDLDTKTGRHNRTFLAPETASRPDHLISSLRSRDRRQIKGFRTDRLLPE